MPFSSNDLLTALPRLRRYARLLTNDPARADQIVAETVARARHVRDDPHLAMLAPAVQLLALLRSVHADQHRPATGLEPGPSQYANAMGAPASANERQPCASSAAADSADELLLQFLRLPLEQREVLALVALERMSYESIATLLSVPAATVLARLVQARETMRSKVSIPAAAPGGSG